MRLRALTDGPVTSTGTVTLEAQTGGGNVGAIAISADGTNLATVVLRKDNASGKIIFQMETTGSIWVIGPIDTEGSQTVYYSVTGTGGKAHIYEWSY